MEKQGGGEPSDGKGENGCWRQDLKLNGKDGGLGSTREKKIGGEKKASNIFFSNQNKLVPILSKFETAN